jgi:hypothetical protein
MRNDIQSINEAFSKATSSSFNREPSRNYNGLSSEEDVRLLDKMIDELYDEAGDGLVGTNEIVSVICGRKFYGNYDDKDLEYVKEVMKEFRGIDVEFDKEQEHMYVVDSEDEEAAPTSDKPGRSSTKFSLQRKNYDQIFYNAWDHIVNELSDEELEATMHMIKNYDELNQLIKDQARYRSNQEARNRAQQYALDRE